MGTPTGFECMGRSTGCLLRPGRINVHVLCNLLLCQRVPVQHWAGGRWYPAGGGHGRGFLRSRPKKD